MRGSSSVVFAEDKVQPEDIDNAKKLLKENPIHAENAYDMLIGNGINHREYVQFWREPRTRVAFGKFVDYIA